MNKTLEEYLSEAPESLTDLQLVGILKFYQFVLQENEIQNLTRLISPKDFYFGHIQDVLELRKLNWVGYPAIDLGSGVGIPGLIAALLAGGEWILCDSEKKKAEYLQRAVETLSLEAKVRVFSGRAEDFLRINKVESIVARAVGPIERIYSWIRSCSTWNTLILFKGPSWNEEWAAFQKTKFRDELKVISEHSYTTGPSNDEKSRKLVQIGRVPRGTLKNSRK